MTAVGHLLLPSEREASQLSRPSSTLRPPPWAPMHDGDPLTVTLAMDRLDNDEAVERGDYWRHHVEVETTDGELLNAEVYVAGEDFVIAEGRPRPWYLDLILLGARKNDLPEEYIKTIEELAR